MFGRTPTLFVFIKRMQSRTREFKHSKPALFVFIKRTLSKRANLEHSKPVLFVFIKRTQLATFIQFEI